MNIVFLLRLWPVYGGGETVTICLANEMVQRGWNVSVAYFKDSIKEQMPFIDDRVQKYKIDGIRCGEFTAEPQDGEKVQDELLKYIKEKNIDIVINQWWPVCYIDKLKTGSDTKIITCKHQALYTPILDVKGIKGKLRNLLLPIYKYLKKMKVIKATKAYFPYVDKYVFLSPLFQQQFEELANFTDKGNILDAIPNPLVYRQELTPDDLKSKEKIVLLVGRMVEVQKRISRAIKIWSIIEKEESLKDWKFQVVGEGPDLPAYKQMAQSLGLKRISFEGYQNPLSYYKKAKIFVMTSAFEGFPMTLVESQQCGVVPIVMDSYLSLHDIVKDGYNGIIVPNGDIIGYANKLKELMVDNAFREQLALNGLVSCKEFSVENVVDKWELLIKRICL